MEKVEIVAVFTNKFGAVHAVYISKISQLIQPNQHSSNRRVLLLFTESNCFYRLKVQMCLERREESRTVAVLCTHASYRSLVTVSCPLCCSLELVIRAFPPFPSSLLALQIPRHDF